MDYYSIYYFQTNIICIVLAAIMLISSYGRDHHWGTDELILQEFLIYEIFYCLADIASCYFNGKSGTSVRVILYIANAAYIYFPIAFAYNFMRYSVYKLEGINIIKTLRGKILVIPLVLQVLLLFCSPAVNLIFYIDEANLYHRGSGAFLIPLITWIYLMVYTFCLLCRIAKSGNHIERDSLKPLAVFILCPVITTVVQLVYYGLSLSQVGFVISIAILYLLRLKNQIFRDELTGLKNRKDMLEYIMGKIASPTGDNGIYICMLDLNRFKYINDTFGHIEGDNALKIVSKVLKETAGAMDQNILVSRYGGDEFVIVNSIDKFEQAERLKVEIKEALDRENETGKRPYTLSVSFGFAKGNVTSFDVFKDLMEVADEDMYIDKAQYKMMHKNPV